MAPFKYLALSLGLAVATTASASPGPVIEVNKSTPEYLERRLLDGSYKMDAQIALDGMIKLAAKMYNEKGNYRHADSLIIQWESDYRQRLFSDKGLGDHEPVRWLLGVYQELVNFFGEDAVKLVHLDDIRIFAYAIPVVFWCEDDVDGAEYKLHFVPFCGALAYSVGFLSCEAALMGSPYTLLCTFVGIGCETLTANVIAPRVNNRAWQMACMK